MIDKHLKNKHLTYEERDFIETGLNLGRKFTKIAKDINKDRTTIAKEIKLHRFKKMPSKFNNYTNLCKNKYNCKKFDCTSKLSCYEEDICSKLLTSPYVCNSCGQKVKCKKVKHYYYSKFANNEYIDVLSNSRLGITLSQSEVYELDKLISPLIKDKNQSIAHIFANHPDEISFSRTTLYSYIDMGILSCKNIDLVRKVKYRPRRKNKKQRIRRETVIRKDRKIEDFHKYIKIHPRCSIVEMDTVEGKKGGKVFLTLLFRKSRFMLIYLMEDKTMECVERVFKSIKENIGIETFKKAFEVILTDNGSEFFNPMSIEKDEKRRNDISCVLL